MKKNKKEAVISYGLSPLSELVIQAITAASGGLWKSLALATMANSICMPMFQLWPYWQNPWPTQK